jgi:hypothetical protein
MFVIWVHKNTQWIIKYFKYKSEYCWSGHSWQQVFSCNSGFNCVFDIFDKWLDVMVKHFTILETKLIIVKTILHTIEWTLGVLVKNLNEMGNIIQKFILLTSKELRYTKNKWFHLVNLFVNSLRFGSPLI